MKVDYSAAAELFLPNIRRGARGRPLTTRSNRNGGPVAPAAGRVVGYARVSTGGQSLDGQLATLKQHGASVIYREKVSGARSDRSQLTRCIAALCLGHPGLGASHDLGPGGLAFKRPRTAGGGSGKGRRTVSAAD